MDNEDTPKWGTPEWYRLHPHYLTVDEMKKSPAILIEEVRNDIANIRGKLNDISCGYGWEDRIDLAEAGLTLVLIQLHGVVDEMTGRKKR